MHVSIHTHAHTTHTHICEIDLENLINRRLDCLKKLKQEGRSGRGGGSSSAPAALLATGIEQRQMRLDKTGGRRYATRRRTHCNMRNISMQSTVSIQTS